MIFIVLPCSYTCTISDSNSFLIPLSRNPFNMLNETILVVSKCALIEIKYQGRLPEIDIIQIWCFGSEGTSVISFYFLYDLCSTKYFIPICRKR